MKTIALLTLSLISLPIFADLQIVTRSPDDGTSTITSNGKMARMDGGGQPGYVLINLSDGSMSMVDESQRSVMQMSGPSLPSNSAATNSTVKVSVSSRGAGPSVAGYKTQAFDISANRRLCSTVYGSQAVLKLNGVKAIFQAMDKMQQQAQNMMGAFAGMRDACEIAEQQSLSQLAKIGAPMRVLDGRGQIESEVVSINKNVSKAASYYQVPAGYQRINMQQQMQQARELQPQMMQQMQQSMPDMNQMMQQMQQQEGMPPEVMEQMRQIQQMMQQQGQ